MKAEEIWDDMARRRYYFHRFEPWEEIRLWGLFFPSEVKNLVKKGLLNVYHNEVPRALNWYYPSEEAYKKFIEPAEERFLNFEYWSSDNGN